MKFRELLPEELLTNTAGVGVGTLMGLNPEETEQVQFHLDRINDNWDGLRAGMFVIRSRFNYLANAMFYLSECEQEFTPQQAMAIIILLGINSVTIEELANGQDKTIESLANMLTPISNPRLECGAHYGQLTHYMWQTAYTQRKTGADIGLGRRVNDDTLIRLMARTANNFVTIGPMTPSDLNKVSYSMGLINASLVYTSQDNIGILPIPQN